MIFKIKDIVTAAQAVAGLTRRGISRDSALSGKTREPVDGAHSADGNMEGISQRRSRMIKRRTTNYKRD